MNESKILNDISEIKTLMNRSSKFLSLSGFSGILAGIYAIVGAYIAYIKVEDYKTHSFRYSKVLEMELFFIAIAVLVLSVSTALLLSYLKAKKNNEKIFGKGSRNFSFALLTPLIIGGIFILLLIRLKIFVIIAPTTLIFYGLALLFASKYTLGSIKYLGFAEVLLGLLAMYFIGHGLLFWVIGFGFFHIIYGTLMIFEMKNREKVNE